MNKKQRNIIVAIVILLIIVIMFLGQKQNMLLRSLQGPIEGTDKVLTVDNKLSIISKNNNVYSWQWNELKKWPVVAKPQASLMTPLSGDKIVYNSLNNPQKLILTDLKAENELANLSLPYGAVCKKLKTSSNGKFGIVLMSEKELLKLASFDSDFKTLTDVFQKNTKNENFTFYDFDITNDGNLVAGTGKTDKAWIFVKDIKNEKILWEKTFDEYGQFNIVKFSPDEKTIYVAEKIRFILVLDAITGNILRTYEIPEYPTPAHQKQNTSCIAVSPDGRIFAGDTEPACTIWYWDIKTGEKIESFLASEFTISDMAFSPDSKYLATGCLVKPEIKIWKVPQPK